MSFPSCLAGDLSLAFASLGSSFLSLVSSPSLMLQQVIEHDFDIDIDNNNWSWQVPNLVIGS